MSYNLVSFLLGTLVAILAIVQSFKNKRKKIQGWSTEESLLFLKLNDLSWSETPSDLSRKKVRLGYYENSLIATYGKMNFRLTRTGKDWTRYFYGTNRAYYLLYIDGKSKPAFNYEHSTTTCFTFLGLSFHSHRVNPLQKIYQNQSLRKEKNHQMKIQRLLVNFV
jgi:hypothetical protein